MHSISRIRLSVYLLIFVTIFLLPSAAQQQPYAGQEQRAIKALSQEEVQALLNGDGMGMAKAAELNAFPGPKHALELRDQLGLTELQAQATQQIFAAMKEEAKRLGAEIVAKEKELDQLFAAGRVEQTQVERLTAEIGQLQGRLRATHLAAHVKLAKVLSPEQIKKYVHLRGYAHGEQKQQHKH